MTMAARALTCPNCGGTIAVKAAGYSVSVGCQHCGALLDVAHPDVAVIERYESAMRELPIPLGKRGTLFDTEWEAIGALARSDGDVDWTETLLFNPYAGYRWLVLSEGEWTFGTMLADRPRGTDGATLWRGQRYNQDYEPAETTTVEVVGEFYWRVKAGDVVTATTFSRGEDLLSAEWSADEINWTQLVLVPGGVIGQAFALGPTGGDSPRGTFGRKGTLSFAETPSRYVERDEAGAAQASADLPKMFGYAFITLMLSMLAMIGFGWATAGVSNRVTVIADGPEASTTIGVVTINRPYQAVTIEARANSFENKWIDIDYTLVDRKTQRGYTAYGLVEHYAGRDSDGPWTEGSHRTVTKLGGIPRGTYLVVADLQAHSWSNSPYATPTPTPSPTPSNPWGLATSSMSPGSSLVPTDGEQIDVELTASAGGILWGNLLLELIVLLGVPLTLLWWRYRER